MNNFKTMKDAIINRTKPAGYKVKTAEEVMLERAQRKAYKEEEDRRQRMDDWYEEFENPEQYIEFKLTMLRKDMMIEPTEEEIAMLRSKTTERDIDRACLAIINRAWSED